MGLLTNSGGHIFTLKSFIKSDFQDFSPSLVSKVTDTLENSNMFRLSISRLGRALQGQVRPTNAVVNSRVLFSSSSRFMSASTETDSEFDNRYEAYFNRPDIDGWEIRKGFGDLAGLDLVPEPAIVAAALRACRRGNDYALTTRILEVTAFKAMHNKDIWPYMVQELKPTLDELGISLPEELGYDKPELMLQTPYLDNV